MYHNMLILFKLFFFAQKFMLVKFLRQELLEQNRSTNR